MTDIETLKEENARLKRELKETKAQNSTYFQNVAHQLTAQLGAIKWSIEALMDERVTHTRRKSLLCSIRSQATILVHLVKNFALMSNLEVDQELGQFREQSEPSDVMRLSVDLAHDFQTQAEARDIDVRIAVNEESFQSVFGKQQLKIEKFLVDQAMSNILMNAVKYADPDTVIKISACTDDQAVGIAIESYGIPIPGGDRDRLCDRGFRGHSAMQKVAAGTGIGLYLASRVMAFHGGRIEVKTKGNHSTFTLVFPQSRLVKA